MYSSTDLDTLLHNYTEGEVLEFKEAKANFDSRDRSDYCAAIANMGGGKLLLGVTNDRRIIGTTVYEGTINKIPHEVFHALGINVRVEEVMHPDGRVVIFDIPPRQKGRPVSSNGHYRYPIRHGESLAEMPESELRQALNELAPDFSATLVAGMNIPQDIDEVALKNFRKWRTDKIGNTRALTDPLDTLLADTGLTLDGQPTFACLALLGTEEKIRRLAPQAEIIYEWRGKHGQTNYDFRKEWRAPYFRIYDDVWDTINARNIRFPFQEGFIQREIWAFDEKVCREAINNAVAHRDYTMTYASIFIHVSPEGFSVTSPGGFLADITPANIVSHKPVWRNRTIADVMAHTKLVERSGQGMDDMYEACIRQGKGYPDFDGTSAQFVQLNIPIVVKDPGFVQYLEKIANEKQIILSLAEMMELDHIREQGVVDTLQHKKFLDLGIVEKIGRTSGTQYMLSHSYYKQHNKLGAYTRIRGLTRDHKKQLILEHIRKEGAGTMKEFMEAFPDVSRADIGSMLQEMKHDEIIYPDGTTRNVAWKLVNNPSK